MRSCPVSKTSCKMRITRRQLRRIIAEEKAKLVEMPMGERFAHCIFNGNYLYDILVDEVDDYLRTQEDQSAPTVLTRTETDKMREALMFALQNIIEDYS